MITRRAYYSQANKTGNVLHGMLINYENFDDPREIAVIFIFRHCLRNV